MKPLRLKGTDADCDALLALMLFHDDPPALASYWAFLKLERRLNGGLKVTLSTRDTQAILSGKGRTELVQRSHNIVRSRTIAGFMLTVSMVDHFAGNSVSQESAVRSLRAWATSPRQRFGDGKAIPKSPMTLKEYWASSRPVAHLWGAFCMGKALPTLYPDGPFKSPRDARRLVSVANALALLFDEVPAPNHFVGTRFLESSLLIPLDDRVKAAPLKAMSATLSNRF